MSGGAVLVWIGLSGVAPAAITDTGDVSPTEETGATPGETGDTGPTDTGLDVDLDEDGFTPRQGDCDDADPELRPGQAEVCFDQLDNDCNGLYDESCDESARLATLQGGGGCTGGQNPGTALVVLVPLLLRRRRG